MGGGDLNFNKCHFIFNVKIKYLYPQKIYINCLFSWNEYININFFNNIFKFIRK